MAPPIVPHALGQAYMPDFRNGQCHTVIFSVPSSQAELLDSCFLSAPRRQEGVWMLGLGQFSNEPQALTVTLLLS